MEALRRIDDGCQWEFQWQDPDVGLMHSPYGPHWPRQNCAVWDRVQFKAAIARSSTAFLESGTSKGFSWISIGVIPCGFLFTDANIETFASAASRLGDFQVWRLWWALGRSGHQRFHRQGQRVLNATEGLETTCYTKFGMNKGNEGQPSHFTPVLVCLGQEGSFQLFEL